MSSRDLIFKLEQETDKLKTVIFRALSFTWSDDDSEIELKYHCFQFVCFLF